MAEQNKNEISWTAPEFIEYRKNPLWFALLLAVGLVLIVYFLFQKDFLTALLFALLLGATMYFGRAKPRTLTITLSSKGLKMNESLIPYQQIKMFWLVYEPPGIKTLNFETRAYLNRFITLQLGGQDPLQIRKYLLRFIPEDLEQEEQVADKISRTLKF